ncbi:hypothetical protein [Xenorhabdus szentirmaii]|uniref:hypothetical protein n=1 Tax=Xenorhabdus szentirmaii TaxID=290112 RepID=UPI0019842075|nr:MULTISPECIES: hypothetical protein [unclassified Xenorhabdus]MBD2805519.1 hypothetical protein [Xenorhabdus sp. ZM]MBD2823888.1 hypothetical protein [Xenorhabdus sp. 5]
MIGTSDVRSHQKANFSISLKLIDTTGAKSGTYLMILDADGFGEAKVPSVEVGGNMEYVRIPSKASSNDIACAIYIRNKETRSYPLVGTLYLIYSPSSGVVDITTMKISLESQLDLDVDRIDNTTFNFKLKNK